MVKIAYYTIQVLMLLMFVFIEAWSIARRRREAETPFVCPNCGEVFYAKWYQLWWGRGWSLTMQGKAKLKCPHCGETDLCRWMREGAE